MAPAMMITEILLPRQAEENNKIAVPERVSLAIRGTARTSRTLNMRQAKSRFFLVACGPRIWQGNDTQGTAYFLHNKCVDQHHTASLSSLIG